MFQAIIESHFILYIDTIALMVFFYLSFSDKNYLYPFWVLSVPLLLDYATEQWDSIYSPATYYIGIFVTHMCLVIKLASLHLKFYTLFVFIGSVIGLSTAVVSTVVQSSDGMNLAIYGLVVFITYCVLNIVTIRLAIAGVFHQRN